MDKEVSLENAVDGRTWTVAFRVPEEFPVWTQGWPELAFHYNLQPGHILVFVLVTHSRFRFTLFNDHGCQIIHPAFSPPSSSPQFYSRRLQSGKSEGATAALKSRAAPWKSKAQPDDGNHHICIQMGISCVVHHNVNPTSRDGKQILEQCEEPGSAGLEPTCMHTGPLQEERALSVTTSQSAGILVDDVPVQIAHVNPISFVFLSKRRDVMPVERRAARRAASRYSHTLSIPNSMTVLRPSHVYKDFDCMVRLIRDFPLSSSRLNSYNADLDVMLIKPTFSSLTFQSPSLVDQAYILTS